MQNTFVYRGNKIIQYGPQEFRFFLIDEDDDVHESSTFSSLELAEEEMDNMLSKNPSFKREE